MTEPIKIRTIKPSFKIALPPSAEAKKKQRRAATKNWRNSTEFKVTRRTRRDHPAPTPLATPCVLWQGRVDSHGYGAYSHQGEHKGTYSTKMHRYIWELFLGRRLKPSEIVMHLCDNPLCYSLLHTELGTIALNNADARAKGRAKKPPRNVFTGEKHPMSMLKRPAVDAIHQMYASGVSYEEIARLTGVTKPHVYKIVKGIHWKAAYDDFHRKENHSE